MALKRLSMRITRVPHWSLILALAAGGAAEFAHGTLRIGLVTVHVTALTFWAYEELVSDVYWFRRVVGACVLIAIVVVLALALA
jgi:hypothetical protein